MKGKIIDIATWVDEFKNETFRMVIESSTPPPFKIGECEVKQK